jgi:hypothetical protein
MPQKQNRYFLRTGHLFSTWLIYVELILSQVQNYSNAMASEITKANREKDNRHFSGKSPLYY